jgi:uncharacterized membrane protein (UPF0182 family)
LLYVEPIYLQSKNNNLPTLVRVVVTDGRKFFMEKDLRTALAKLVGDSDLMRGKSASTEPLLPLDQTPSNPLP